MEPLFTLNHISKEIFRIEIFPPFPGADHSMSYEVIVNAHDVLWLRIKDDAARVSGDKACTINESLLTLICILIESDSAKSRLN